MAKQIAIKGNSKRNGLSLMLFGSLLWLLAFALLGRLPSPFTLMPLALMASGFFMLLLGWVKQQEPEFSLRIDEQGLTHYHRRGQWFVSWHDIQCVDQPRETVGLEQIPLNYLGIRVRDYQTLLAAMPSKLANHLLLEQRALLNVDKSGCYQGHCASVDWFEQDTYKFADGTQIKGIKAMFANRMQRLRALHGYDLYIAATELDREISDMVATIHACQANLSAEN